MNHFDWYVSNEYIKGIAHYFLWLIMKGRGYQPLWMPLGCLLCWWSKVIRRVCILCEYKGLPGIYWGMQNFSYGEAFYTAGTSAHVWGRLLAWRKNKTTPPPPLLSVGFTPLTPLTCIAGLVGVKIDWQSLNWKWSLNAGYSCLGFEFSLSPANRAADGKNWWGICWRTEQRSSG